MEKAIDYKINKPLICHAGSAAEASVGSLPLVKNMSKFGT